MQEPARWIGTSPSDPVWEDNSRQVFFKWNPDVAPGDSLYMYDLRSGNIQKASRRVTGIPDANPYFNVQKAKKLYLQNGDLYEEEVKNGKALQLTRNISGISNISYAANGSDIYFTLNDNLVLLDRKTGTLQQLTDFKKGNKPSEIEPTQQNKWLQQDQLAFFEVLEQRKQKQEQAELARARDQQRRPQPIYISDARVDNQTASPDGRYITFRLISAPGDEGTKVPSFVTESGYTELLDARAKVGSRQISSRMGIYDTRRDTVYFLQTKDLPGLDKLPDFAKDYPDKEFKRNTDVVIHGPFYPENGSSSALLEVRSLDNKDRWIGLADLATGKMEVLDHQRDEAWIGGPGIGWLFSPGAIGWLPGGSKFWFQSEESGYAHLYTYDVGSKQKKQLTSGNYEVYDPQISRNGRYWYFHSNMVHPGVRHFYRMPIEGGKMEQLTSGDGRWDATLSPDEKTLALLFSTGNTPPELYLQPNRSGGSPKKITSSLTEEWQAYPWRMPEYVSFKASDGASVPARLYRPANGSQNGPAVIFVHGAGYLQNAHKWWSSYFREYMFHNLLADKGYTVLDIDYRGSAGYGRDWRTGIYRHMGGKDLSDHVDGARWLVEELGVDSSRLGIYGGSYGGFITLMAMFTEPGVFKAGAALRSVTDWAHYNHPYTANILNEPYTDSLAYARSSPIYYAEGLKGHLLIAHGMIDTNVHFQDVVRLSQRLIELGKEDWELAVYPLEDHGFVEPSSWTDEYRRILKLFDETIGSDRNKPAE
ncbi:S9 family peptidase [Cesiribacter sp. SM1]|uniref:S9 family peptidase n=1 Tax=Cesiribacter sp. SM1 TaxID=2861196 RepID=UPI001CD7AF3D|nr:S9 family peptidase [Cesiribacter sp. SM1]